MQRWTGAENTAWQRTEHSNRTPTKDSEDFHSYYRSPEFTSTQLNPSLYSIECSCVARCKPPRPSAISLLNGVHGLEGGGVSEIEENEDSSVDIDEIMDPEGAPARRILRLEAT